MGTGRCDQGVAGVGGRLCLREGNLRLSTDSRTQTNSGDSVSRFKGTRDLLPYQLLPALGANQHLEEVGCEGV